MRRVNLFAAAVLAALVLASAGRVPDTRGAFEDGELLDLGAHAVNPVTWLTNRGKGDRDEPAYFAIKLYVQPHLHEDFIDAWRKVNDKVKDDKAMKVYDLKKTNYDNLVFAIYGEWETKKDLVKYFEADYTQDFLDFLAENEIVWKLYPLKKVVKETEREEGEGKGRKSHKLAHVLIKYIVPPHQHNKFIDAWEDTAKDTWEEKGNRIYSLRKTLTDNLVFTVYGTWDTMDDYFRHLESDHVQRLLDFNRKNDIVYFLAPLYKIGDQPE